MNKIEENSESQDIPDWSGFHELCGEPSFPVRVVYLPPILATPTDMVCHICCNKPFTRHDG